MGTNFYVTKRLTNREKEELKELIDLEKLNEVKEKIPVEVHIGKRSGGWRFCFNHNDWQYYKNIEELEAFIEQNEFYNEYGEEVDPDEFWQEVYRREEDPEMLDGDRYAERWNEIHPGTNKPDYMLRGYKGDEEHFGYRFSTSTEFS